MSICGEFQNLMQWRSLGRFSAFYFGRSDKQRQKKRPLLRAAFGNGFNVCFAGGFRGLEHCGSEFFAAFCAQVCGGDIEDRFAAALPLFVQSVCGSCVCQENARGKLGVGIEFEAVFYDVAVFVVKARFAAS